MSKPRRKIVVREMTVDEAERAGKRVCPALKELAKRGIKVVIKDDPAPIALILGGLMWFGKTAGANILTSVVDSVTSPITNLVELAIRSKVLEWRANDIFSAIMESFKFQAFAPSVEDSAGVNYDESHASDMVLNLARATLFLTQIISDDAGELAMESLSEAISQAVYSGFAGQLQNMANYRSGFLPPQNIHMEDEYGNFDVNTRAIMDAFAGYQIHESIANEALRTIKSAGDTFRRFALLDDMAETLEAVRSPKLVWLSEGARLIRDAFRDLVEDVRAMLYTLLRRVGDILMEVKVAKADYDAGLITESEYNVVLLDAYLELQEIDDEADDIMADMEDALGEMPNSFDNAAVNVASAYNSLVDLYGDYLDNVILSDFDDYVNNMMLLRTYTKVSGIGWYLYNRVKGTYHGGQA